MLVPRCIFAPHVHGLYVYVRGARRRDACMYFFCFFTRVAEPGWPHMSVIFACVFVLWIFTYAAKSERVICINLVLTVSARVCGYL